MEMYIRNSNVLLNILDPAVANKWAQRTHHSSEGGRLGRVSFVPMPSPIQASLYVASDYITGKDHRWLAVQPLDLSVSSTWPATTLSHGVTPDPRTAYTGTVPRCEP